MLGSLLEALKIAIEAVRLLKRVRALEDRCAKLEADLKAEAAFRYKLRAFFSRLDMDE